MLLLDDARGNRGHTSSRGSCHPPQALLPWWDMSHSTKIFTESLSDSWTGRKDGPNPENALWYTTIQAIPDPDSAPPGAALLGFASDEGIRRNYGRPGADEGPDAIRGSLGWVAVHDEHPRYDAGDVGIIENNLDRGHDELTDAVERLAKAGHLPIVLGGGHEAGFGSHRGIYQALGNKSPAIINLDAHLDLRKSEQPTNGTPFRQVAELVGEEFNYAVLGVSPPDNTQFLFNSAREMGVRITTDDQLNDLSPGKAAELALEIVEDQSDVHLTIDLDVLSAAITPGVSSPSAVGVSMANIRAICTALAETGKLRLVDVVELNPSLDVDKRTARVAARLIHEIAQTHLVAN